MICQPSCKCPTPICSCNQLPTVQGLLNGHKATTLRDTGCSGVVVRAEYVHSKQYTGRNKLCLLIDGTAKSVPLAKVKIDSPFFTGEAEAMVMAMPIYDLIIGNIPGAHQPDQPDRSWKMPTNIEESHAVITRQQGKKARELTKPLHVPIGNTTNPSKQEDLAREQDQDPALENLFKKARSKEPPKITKASKTWFEIKHNVLYRMFQKLNHPRDPVTRQLVVPKGKHAEILKVAHESIMAGHMGIQRTLDRILSQFYWPGIHGDVIRYCRSCDACQRTTPKGKIYKATLEQMPLIDTPFKRVAVDLIGPITPRSKQGNKYILTLVVYATRYPEAKALPNIDTETVAEALLEMYSRVGFPSELLSDLGTQFTSDVMKEVSRLISVNRLVTTPYHPMCNGLCERFNGTLKTILKRLCAEKPEDWDRYLPATLFAYREVPQESLGFSPFEMLYGHHVRGPMDILRALWTKEVDDPSVETSYTYVMNLKERIAETCRIAQEELSKSSKKYKKYHDRRARNRRFLPGQEALLLLPTSHNKLLMQWKGPFKVLERVNQHNYRIDVNGKQRLFHVNMLKEYSRRDTDLENGHVSAGLSEVPVGDESPYEAVAMATTEEDGSDDEYSVCESPFSGKETYKDVNYSNNLTEKQVQQAKELVFEYRDVFSDLPGNTNLVEHSIRLTVNDPIKQRPYQLPYAVRETTKREIQDMLDMDVIEHTNSPYASPIVNVKKKDGTNRLCVDFRKLNRVTVFDNEPMANAEDIYAKLKDDQYLTKLDLAKGYWQIPVKVEDREKTAFVTPDGCYQFKRMPFGLVNSTATFNRMMRRAFDGVKDADKFVDDLLAHTKTWDEHIYTLREIFARLRSARLNVRPTKCFIGFSDLEFVGHQIGNGTLRPSQDKVDEIMKAQRPQTKRQVRAFIGCIGFYRQFIPNFATIAVPLTDLTKKGQPNVVKWGNAQEAAFHTLKKLLSMDPILRVPDFNQPFILQTDASDNGLGAVLTQDFDDIRHPVAFASKKLLPREKRYSTIEKECLAIVWAIKKFYIYLYGREFVVETDHQPLVYIGQSKFTNSRIMRWALFLQNFRFRVINVKGKENVMADYLSRVH